jgi:hypothetical protein
MPAFFTSISAPVFLKQLWGQKNHNFETKAGPGFHAHFLDLFAPDFFQQDLLAAIIRNRLAT